MFYGIYYGVTEGGLGLSVLRTFRLLRIIKIVRFFLYKFLQALKATIQVPTKPSAISSCDAEDYG